MILVGLGTGLMATSILWEYVRMRPDYRFIVEPWSVRGFETAQGWVVAAIATTVLVIAILVTTGVLKETLPTIVSVAVATTALGVVLAAVTDPREPVIGTFGTWGLAVLAGMAAAAIATATLPKGLKARSWTTLAVFVAALLIAAFAVFDPLLGGEAVPLWAVVLIGLGLLNVVVVVWPPRQLALYRLMINGGLIAWFVSFVMSGSLRSLLATRQLDTMDMGIAAEIRDIQITSGVMLAWAGGLLAFLGTVSLWARRRDQLDAVARARRQLEAARRSAEEMGKTLEESHAAIDEESVAESVGGPAV